MTSLEGKFDADMHNIYVTAKKELRYNALRFMQISCTNSKNSCEDVFIFAVQNTRKLELMALV